MTHVLFMTFHLPRPQEPGAARPWEELQLMRELGCDVTVVTASTHYLTEVIEKPVTGLWRTDREDGVTVIRTWSPTRYRRSLLRRFGCYLAYSVIMPLASVSVREVDVVFSATDPPFMTPGAYLASLLHRAKLVLDERDIYPDTLLWLGIHPPRPVLAILSGWGKWLRQRATAVITVSPGFMRLLAERGARPRDTYLITNFFPHGDIDVVPPPPVSANPNHPMIVLYAGGLGAATDVDAILDAAAIIQQRGYADRIQFQFLGAGERREEYTERSRALDNVEFLAAVPRSEMPRIFAGIHVAIHSLGPQWSNSLSSKIFEYMGHGRPVLFAGEGDIADVLAESGGGVTVAPGDATGIANALIGLREDETRRGEMGEKARQYVSRRFNRDDVRMMFGRALGVTPTGHSAERLTDIDDDSLWDALVSTCPGGEIFHSSAWLRLLSEVYGARPRRLGLSRDGELIAGIPVLVRRLGPFRIAGSPLPGTTTPQMGPLAKEPGGIADVLSAFDRWQRQERIAISHLICSGPVESEQLQTVGYDVEPHRTMLLDLRDKTADDLWTGFKSECRTAIRKAEKSGVEVCAAHDLSFIGEYLEMAEGVFARQGRSAPTPREFYEALWRRFHPSGTLQVLLARHDGKIVSGALFLAHERRLYYLDGASCARGNTLRANNLIHWTILRWAADRRMIQYDMVGADTPELIRFKSTFGSRLVERPRAHRTSSAIVAAAMQTYLLVRPTVRHALFRLTSRGEGTVSATSGAPTELERLRAVYQRRTGDPALVTRYDAANPGNAINQEQLMRALAALADHHFGGTLAGQRILEVGCGSGGFLSSLRTLGADQAGYTGVDLMPHLVEAAAVTHPEATFLAGSAHDLPLPDDQYDIVCQVTLMTSILDGRVRKMVANEMDRVIRPGGKVLWLDFWFNPTNPEVHGIRRGEIASLFPDYDLHLCQVMLVPPLARYLGPRFPPLVRQLSRIRPLRTHYLGILTKPHDPPNNREQLPSWRRRTR